MELIKAPAPLPRAFTRRPAFFLGGGIKPWRGDFINTLSSYDCTILDPVRNDWRAEWGCALDDPHFVEQVSWETDAQQRAHHVLQFFPHDLPCPITLLEFGMAVMGVGGEVAIVVEEGYSRKGYLDFFCERYDIPKFAGLDELAVYAIRQIKKWEETHSGSIERRLNG